MKNYTWPVCTWRATRTEGPTAEHQLRLRSGGMRRCHKTPFWGGGCCPSTGRAPGCESWTIMKAEHRRIDAFKLWCWRRLLRVPWTERRSNQSILKEISPEYSLEGLKLKLKLQYFGHLMRRADSLEKTLMLGKTEGRRRGWQRWEGWMASPAQWTWVWAGSRSWWCTGKPGVLQSMGSQRAGHNWATDLNWGFWRIPQGKALGKMDESTAEMESRGSGKSMKLETAHQVSQTIGR